MKISEKNVCNIQHNNSFLHLDSNKQIATKHHCKLTVLLAGLHSMEHLKQQFLSRCMKVDVGTLSARRLVRNQFIFMRRRELNAGWSDGNALSPLMPNKK